MTAVADPTSPPPPQEPSAPPAPPTERARGLRSITGGFPAAPLAVLFGLNLVDEFDRVAFSALLPEIRDAFGLSDGQVLTLGAITGVFTLIAALPLGVLADRFNRVRLSVAAAILWGATSVLTGVVPGLVLLYLVRLGSGLGRIINEVVHPSLLADYYPRENQPRVFGVHRAANPIGNIGGPLAGLVAATFFWQAAFWILAIPTAVFVALAIVRLREPKRGESIDADLAAQSELDAESTPYGEARRQLFAIKTLRRLWLGAFFLGVGALQIGNILGIFFDRVYGVGPVGRGMVQLLFGAGNLVGLIFGARLAGRASEAGRLNRLAVITGLSFVQFAGGLVLLGAVNWVVMGYVAAFVLSLGVGAYQPAYYALVGLVSPPKIRAQAYAWAILIYGCGGLSFIFLVGVGDEDSATRLRVIVVILAAIVALAGMIGASAQRFVNRDSEQAANALATAARLRDELAAGGADKTLLVCRGVDVAYDTVQILFGVDMEVKEGEIIALLGTNGAGKSTLLKAICGLVDPIGGAIFFDGRDITHADAVQAAKAGIVQVPGGKAIFPTLTVAEHFRAGTWLFQDEDPADVQKRIDEVLEMFPRLKERWDQLAGNMSGGEQQQLALGMAFVAKPKLLIIDELSLGLAPTIVEQLLNIVRKIHASGCTIILVEQSVNVALTIATKAYFMEKGEVRFSGPTEELLERKDILRSVFLEGTGGKAPAVAAKGSEVATGPDRSRPPIMKVTGLTKRFGGITAVDDVSFELAHGEILGLIGPNGAGKTTIFDLLSGLLPLDAGRIELHGIDVTNWGPDRRAAAGLGRSFQDARIFPSLTVAENVAIGLERHIEVRDHLAAALNLPSVQEAEEDVAWTVADLIELMNLGAFRDKFVSELSTGSRRIVDLAMSIAHDPSVLILDEPSSGIAQKETEALGPLLKRIQRETGCSMLVIEHDMPLITSVSDEMIALELGAVVVRGTPSEVISNPRVVSSYLGGDIDVINRSGASTELSKRKAAAGGDVDGVEEEDESPRTRRRRRREEVEG